MAHRTQKGTYVQSGLLVYYKGYNSGIPKYNGCIRQGGWGGLVVQSFHVLFRHTTLPALSVHQAGSSLNPVI